MTSAARPTRVFLTIALLWCVYLLASTGFRVLVGPTRTADYGCLVLALVGATACAVLLPSRTPLKGQFCLAIGSAILTLLALETLVVIYVTVAPPLATYQSRAERLGVPFDTRSSYEVFVDLRRTDSSVVMHFPACRGFSDGFVSGEGAVLPLAGPSQATTLFDNETGEYLVYTSDRHGFNNPVDLWEPGKVEIALIGDSFTVGAYVTPSDNISGVLNAAGYSTINLGVSCSGPLMSLARLKEYAAVLRPPIVMWIYFEGNDLSEFEDEKQSAGMLRYLEEDYLQNLTERQDEIDRVVSTYLEGIVEGGFDSRESDRGPQDPSGLRNSLPARILRLANLRDISRLVAGYTYDPYFTPAPSDPDLELLGVTLSEAKRVTESWGGDLWFVYLPSYQRYSQRVDQDSYHSRAAVLEIVDQVGIRLIDFHEPMTRSADPLALFPFGLPGHYTVEGYRLVADEMERQALTPR